MKTFDLSSFKQKFIDEALSLLLNLDNCLIELERNPAEIQYINEAFRVMHTIKGTSGMYGFEKLVELTHEIESLYSVVRENGLVVSNSLLDLTFASVDHIRALLFDEACTNPENIARQGKLLSAIILLRQEMGQQVCVQPAVKALPKIGKNTSWNILFYPHDQIVTRAINLFYVFQDLFLLGECKIHHQPFKSENEQYWSIFLTTDKGYGAIEEALLFVMDYCRITKIADYNVFSPEDMQKWDDELELSALSVRPENQVVQSNEPSSGISAVNDIKSDAGSVPQRHTTRHINVSAAKLDSLMYLVSELVTAKSELKIAIQQKNLQKASDTTEKIEKLSTQFSDNALSIRLVSLNEMLSRFKRLVRDLSKQLGKPIRFLTSGEDTELDKNIIDNVGEPIMHLIRNCIDHGIELSDTRNECGKPTEGTIRFDAAQKGNYVYITISDDGKGIDKDYLYRKAVEKGFVHPGIELNEKECLDLIFLPGFSTAQNITNVSGRGVGMDVVKRTLQEIRGEIAIDSQIGVGTTFTLKLQQSISIMDTLLIQSGGTTYAIPIEDVEACHLESSDRFNRQSNKHIGYNGRLIPYINLAQIGGDPPLDVGGDTEKLIVVKRHDKTYAIVADQIIGEYQAVVKPLGECLTDIKFLSGASLLGDGTVALILDTDKLWLEIR